MKQEEINKAAEDAAFNAFCLLEDSEQKTLEAAFSEAFQAGAALMQPEIERLKELVERYENTLKSFGQSLTT